MTACATRIASGLRAALLAATLGPMPAVALAGAGGLPGFSPSPFAFGSVPVGLSSPTQAFTLNNPSAETLTVTSSGLGGAAPAQYAIVSNTCAGAVLAPGANCAIAVRFTPSAAGNQVALVRALYTSPGSPGGVEVTAAISGTGLPPPTPAPAVAAPAVGSVALGLGALLMLLGAWVGRRPG
jgi:hypothetical protein